MIYLSRDKLHTEFGEVLNENITNALQMYSTRILKFRNIDWSLCVISIERICPKIECKYEPKGHVS